MTARNETIEWLKELRALDATCLQTISEQNKRLVLDAAGEICFHLKQDLGVAWKAHPTDDRLRALTVNWITSGLDCENELINMQFLLCVDVAVTYIERIYEGLDMELRILLVKYIATAIYLDDLIDKDADIAAEAETFLLQSFDSKISAFPFLRQYRQAALDLAKHIPDPLAGSMLLHSCTSFIEGCVLEYRNNQLGGTLSSIKDATTESKQDATERDFASRGLEVSLPLDADFGGSGCHPVPPLWPTWLREKSGICEAFAIPSFCAPGGIDLPIRLWVAALPEMRGFINHVNDILSFSKELLEGDSASYIAVVTKEHRAIGMPGTAQDGGWCLRDTFSEVYTKVLSAASRINRLLRPLPEIRYNPDGSRREISELVALLQVDGLDKPEKEELMKALCISLWETHKNGFVCYHFQTRRYRTYQLFEWVAEMVGEEPPGSNWLISQLTR